MVNESSPTDYYFSSDFDYYRLANTYSIAQAKLNSEFISTKIDSIQVQRATHGRTLLNDTCDVNIKV